MPCPLDILDWLSALLTPSRSACIVACTCIVHWVPQSLPADAASSAEDGADADNQQIRRQENTRLTLSISIYLFKRQGLAARVIPWKKSQMLIKTPNPRSVRASPHSGATWLHGYTTYSSSLAQSSRSGSGASHRCRGGMCCETCVWCFAYLLNIPSLPVRAWHSDMELPDKDETFSSPHCVWKLASGTSFHHSSPNRRAPFSTIENLRTFLAKVGKVNSSLSLGC